MKLSSVKVSKSDDRLAHGLVKSRAAQLFDPKFRGPSLKRFRDIKSAKALVEYLTKTYGKRLLHLRAGRLTGDRARVDAFVADACAEGGYVLGTFQWLGNVRPHLQVDVLGCYVDPHAVARMIQREVGAGDVDEAVAKVFRPLVEWGARGEKPQGNRMTLRGFGGELRCICSDTGFVVGKTWIDTDSLPEWKRAEAEKPELTVEHSEEK